MKLVELVKGKYPHKWTAIFDDGKRVSFGHADYEDYTQHHDKERRMLYRIRHKKDLEVRNPATPAYLSYYVLWGSSTSLQANLETFKRRFHL